MSPVTVLALPDLVVDNLLRFLDTTSKLNLRLTCKTMSYWVNSDRIFLSGFRVMISDLKLMESEELRKFNYFASPSSSYLQIWTNDFFQIITKLEITEFLLDNFTWATVCKFNCLRELYLLNLFGDTNIKGINFLPLNCMTVFEVTRLYFSNSDDLETLVKFCKVLLSGPRIQRFKIPRLSNGDLAEQSFSWEALKNLQLSNIVGPWSESFIHSNTTVDCCQVSSQNFAVLAANCVERGGFLQNVNDKQVKAVFYDDDNFLRHILSLREKVDDRRDIRKWENLKEMFIRTVRCDVRNYYENDILFPNLRKLTIVLDSSSKQDPGFLSLHRVLHFTFSKRRVTLQDLTIVIPDFGHDTPKEVINFHDIVCNFSNLRKLTLKGRAWKEESYEALSEYMKQSGLGCELRIIF